MLVSSASFVLGNRRSPNPGDCVARRGTILDMPLRRRFDRGTVQVHVGDPTVNEDSGANSIEKLEEKVVRFDLKNVVK